MANEPTSETGGKVDLTDHVFVSEEGEVLSIEEVKELVKQAEATSSELGYTLQAPSKWF